MSKMTACEKKRTVILTIWLWSSFGFVLFCTEIRVYRFPSKYARNAGLLDGIKPLFDRGGLGGFDGFEYGYGFGKVFSGFFRVFQAVVS